MEDTMIIFSSDNGIPFPSGRTNFYEPGQGHLILTIQKIGPNTYVSSSLENRVILLLQITIFQKSVFAVVSVVLYSAAASISLPFLANTSRECAASERRTMPQKTNTFFYFALLRNPPTIDDFSASISFQVIRDWSSGGECSS